MERICALFYRVGRGAGIDSRGFLQPYENAIILDGRNCYSVESFEARKVVYDSIGRKTVNTLF